MSVTAVDLRREQEAHSETRDALSKANEAVASLRARLADAETKATQAETRARRLERENLRLSEAAKAPATEPKRIHVQTPEDRAEIARLRAENSVLTREVAALRSGRAD